MEKTKDNSKKPTVMIVTISILVVAVIWLVVALLRSDSPTGSDAVTVTTLVKESAGSAEVSPMQNTDITVPKPDVNAGNILLDKSWELSDKDNFVKLQLRERVRYKIEFQADKPVRFVMYSKTMYDRWKELNSHTSSKITTMSTNGCCQSSGAYVIDLNNGESGEYYFVFDRSDTVGTQDLAKTGKLVITEMSSI